MDISEVRTDDGKTRIEDVKGAEAPSHQGRAAYLEQVSARILRAATRTLKDAPGTLAEVSALVGELLVELRRAEEANHRLRERLDAVTVRHRDLLDHIPVPCSVIDERGDVTNVNREALLLFRASKRQMIERPAALWFNDRVAAERFVHELRTNAGPAHRQLDIKPRDRRATPATVILQQVDGAEPPLWRCFLLTGRSAG